MSESFGFILPVQHLQDLARLGRDLADLHLAGQAVERRPVAFLHRRAAHRELLVLLVDDQRAGADHRGLPHLAADDRRVRGHAAGRREHAFGDFHAVDVVGHRLLADQQHLLALLRPLDRVVGGEDHLARRRARRGRQPLGQRRQLLPLGRVEHRREQLRQRGRLDQQQARPWARRSFSFTKSVAMTTDAYPVRLPFRVCSM